jgi:hypothetical protein
MGVVRHQVFHFVVGAPDVAIVSWEVDQLGCAKRPFVELDAVAVPSTIRYVVAV